MSDTPNPPLHEHVNSILNFDRGEPDDYEITYKDGKVDRLKAHQVSWPNNGVGFFDTKDTRPLVRFHGEVDGRWRLLLSADETDIKSIRNITQLGGEV